MQPSLPTSPSPSASGPRFRLKAPIAAILAASLLVGTNVWLALSAFYPLPPADVAAVSAGTRGLHYVLVSSSFVTGALAWLAAAALLILLHIRVEGRRARLAGTAASGGRAALSDGNTRYLQPLWWMAASLVPLATLVLPEGWRVPPLAYVLYDLRFFWWPIVLVAVLKRAELPLPFVDFTDGGGGLRRSRALRLVLIIVVPVAAAIAFTPQLRFSGILHGDEPKYLRYCESFFQGTGFDVSQRRLLTELPDRHRGHVLNNGRLFLEAVPEEVRALVNDARRLTGLSHRPRLVSQEPTPAMFFVGKHPGTFYQLHNPGVSFLLFPGYYVDRRFTGEGVGDRNEFPESMPALHVNLLALFAAYAGALYLLLRDQSGDRAVAAGLAAVGAGAMPAGAFAFQIYPEIAAGVVIFLVTRWLLSRAERSRPVIDAWHGAAVGFLPWLHVRLTVVTVVAIGWALLRVATTSQGRRRAWVFAGGAVLGLVSIAFYTYHLTGSFMPTATYGTDAPLSLGRMIRGLPGMAFDGVWGLLPHAPIYLMACLGIAATWRRQRDAAILIGLMLAAVVLPAAGHGYWAGGSTPGRYLVSAAPLLLIPIADSVVLWWRRPIVQALLLATIVISLETAVQYNLHHLKHQGPLVAEGFAGWRPNLLFPVLGTETWSGTWRDIALLAGWIVLALALLAAGITMGSDRGQTGVRPLSDPCLTPKWIAGVTFAIIVAISLPGFVLPAQYLPSHQTAREQILAKFAGVNRCAVCIFSDHGFANPTAVLNNHVGLIDLRVRPDAVTADTTAALRIRPRSVDGQRLVAALLRVEFGDGTSTELHRVFGDIDVPHRYASAGDYLAQVTVVGGDVESPVASNDVRSESVQVHVADR